MAPKKARKEDKEGREDQESSHNWKEEAIVEKYESGIYVTDLANTYSMSKPTISIVLQRKVCIKKLMLLKVLLKMLSHDQCVRWGRKAIVSVDKLKAVAWVYNLWKS